MTVRGDVRMRYGGGPCRFQTDQLAVPELREVAFTYESPRGLVGSAGRFKPSARMAGVIDGAQVAYRDDRLSMSAFAGLRPSLSTLAPRGDAPAMGVAAAYQGDRAAGEHWRLAAAYMMEGGGGLRQSLAGDSSVGAGDRWLRQAATLRLPGGDVPGGVALMSVQGQLRSEEGRGLDGALRYIDQPLAGVDVTPQTQDWIWALQGQALARADLGVNLPRGEGKTLRPYAYWHHQLLATEPDVFVAAAGLSLRRQGLGPRNFSLDLHGDDGDGTRQQARLGLDLRSAPKAGFVTTFGLQHQWTFTHVSGLHTFQHLVHSNVIWRSESPLDLWMGLQGGLDHSLYVQKAAGAWGAGQLGLSYEWLGVSSRQIE